jgi:hypothetical protein
LKSVGPYAIYAHWGIFGFQIMVYCSLGWQLLGNCFEELRNLNEELEFKFWLSLFWVFFPPWFKRQVIPYSSSLCYPYLLKLTLSCGSFWVSPLSFWSASWSLYCISSSYQTYPALMSTNV